MGIKVPTDNLVIENAQITWRNFAGAEGPFNPKGVRSFSLILESVEQAQALEELGWKVKWPKPREDGEPARYAATMPVFVKYHPRLQPPKIKMIVPSRNIQTNIDEEALDVLDYVSIKKCDMILRPYHWKQPTGTEGVKNMCSSLYITIQEDELELKYADIPEVGPGATNQRAIESGDVWDEPLEDMGEQNERRAIGAGF